MGVRGLQSFLKNNPSIGQKSSLANTNLVIDANNLLCLLFCNLCNQTSSEQYRCDIYGGDMVAYSQAVKEFFAALDKCNITPVLVCDGSVIGKQSTRNQIALKEGAIYQRGLERFQTVRTITEDYPNEKLILPQTINHVFKSIASELGIQLIQTPYEADTHIARVANDLNCPVLSDDSDFLIYSLPQGFIMFDNFSYKSPVTARNGQNYIQCFICSQCRLIRNIPGLKAENMPLLSILLGNDYVEAGTFDRVLESICGRPYNGTLQTATRNHRRIANLLTWLKDKTLEEAIEYILSQLQAGCRDRLRQTIKILLRNYKIEETDNFEAEVQDIYPSSEADPEANIHPELMPTAYLRRLLENGDLSAVALDIIFHNTYYNYAIIDDFQLPSSSYVKYRPYSLAVTLLRPKSYCNMTTYRRQMELEKDTFYICDRINDDYKKISIKPLEKLDDFGSLEHLNCYSMITLEPALKKSLLMTVFKFNGEELNLMTDTVSRIFTNQFIQETCICLLLIKYIGLETKQNPKPQFVDALLLTLFYYAALNGQLNKELINDSAYGKVLLRLRPHSIKNNGRQYESSPMLYRRIVHFISQLQSAYTAYHLLNGLLNNALQHNPKYEKFFNSTLIYRLTKLLRLGEIKLITLCSEMPVFLEVCNIIRLMVNCDD